MKGEIAAVFGLPRIVQGVRKAPTNSLCMIAAAAGGARALSARLFIGLRGRDFCSRGCAIWTHLRQIGGRLGFSERELGRCGKRLEAGGSDHALRRWASLSLG